MWIGSSPTSVSTATTTMPSAEDGQGTAAQLDEDEAMDAWLASLSAGQLDHIMSFLMDRVYGAPSAFDRPVA